MDLCGENNYSGPAQQGAGLTFITPSQTFRINQRGAPGLSSPGLREEIPH